MDLPELARDGAESVKAKATSVIPWLPDPWVCECGGACVADMQFVEEQAMPVQVWQCRECKRRYYRDENSSVSANPYK